MMNIYVCSVPERLSECDFVEKQTRCTLTDKPCDLLTVGECGQLKAEESCRSCGSC